MKQTLVQVPPYRLPCFVACSSNLRQLWNSIASWSQVLLRFKSSFASTRFFIFTWLKKKLNQVSREWSVGPWLRWKYVRICIYIYIYIYIYYHCIYNDNNISKFMIYTMIISQKKKIILCAYDGWIWLGMAG